MRRQYHHGLEGTEWVGLNVVFKRRLSLRTALEEKKEKKEKVEKKEDNVNALDKDWKCGSVASHAACNA